MTEAVLLAIINNFEKWLIAVAGVLSAWSLFRSRRTDIAVKQQREEVEKKTQAVEQCVQTLTTKAEETKAIAEHAQTEMAATREENRKLYHFMQTDAFIVQATAPTDSGPQLLAPTDFGDMLEDKK